MDIFGTGGISFNTGALVYSGTGETWSRPIGFTSFGLIFANQSGGSPQPLVFTGTFTGNATGNIILTGSNTLDNEIASSIPANSVTKTGVGTLVSEGKEVKSFGGEDYILEQGIFADVAIVKAWKADATGNTVFRKTARNFNVPAATCGKVCVVEVEGQRALQAACAAQSHQRSPGSPWLVAMTAHPEANSPACLPACLPA